jgi:hypothetical protein
VINTVRIFPRGVIFCKYRLGRRLYGSFKTLGRHGPKPQTQGLIAGTINGLLYAGLDANFEGLGYYDRFAISHSWFESIRAGYAKGESIQARSERMEKHDVLGSPLRVYKNGQQNFAI